MGFRAAQAWKRGLLTPGPPKNLLLTWGLGRPLLVPSLIPTGALTEPLMSGCRTVCWNCHRAPCGRLAAPLREWPQWLKGDLCSGAFGGSAGFAKVPVAKPLGMTLPTGHQVDQRPQGRRQCAQGGATIVLGVGHVPISRPPGNKPLLCCLAHTPHPFTAQAPALPCPGQPSPQVPQSSKSLCFAEGSLMPSMRQEPCQVTKKLNHSITMK